MASFLRFSGAIFFIVLSIVCAASKFEGITSDSISLDNQLILAVKEGNYEDTVDLIKLGADVNFLDFYGNTTLHLAVLGRHENIVDALLDAHFKNVDAVDSYGYTALQTAAANGLVVSVSKIISAGANINTVDERLSNTALHLAIMNGHVEVTRILLSQAAINTGIKNCFGKTPRELNNFTTFSRLFEEYDMKKHMMNTSK